MNLQEISTSVLMFIALESGKGFIQRAGARLFEIIEETIQKVRRKFRGDTSAEKILKRAVEDPESEDCRTALQEILIEKMEEDNAFAENLSQLIRAANLADTNHVLALGKRSVAVGKNMKDSTIITGDSNVVDGGISQSITTTGGSTISGIDQIDGEAKETERND